MKVPKFSFLSYYTVCYDCCFSSIPAEKKILDPNAHNLVISSCLLFSIYIGKSILHQIILEKKEMLSFVYFFLSLFCSRFFIADDILGNQFLFFVCMCVCVCELRSFIPIIVLSNIFHTPTHTHSLSLSVS